MKKLAGVIFVYNGSKFDYCYLEAINSLIECTDHVFIVAGGVDNTYECVLAEFNKNENCTIIYLSNELWDLQSGREKLNFFTNIGIEAAQREGYEYQFNLQADEIIHEKSYDAIRKAINSGLGEAYMCSRINLWESPYMQLNVEHARMPCSKEIIRLAKTQYRSCGDAESIDAQCVMNFVKDIEIWHYGFVRKKEVMKSKIINMQCGVFGMSDYDAKLNECEVFNSKLWFDGDDLAIIDSPHPKIMKEWISIRP